MSPASLIAACVQVTAGPEIGPNLVAAAALVREARAAGAELITLPENVALMVQGRDAIWAQARPEAEHPAVPFFAALARETGAWLLGGSIAVRLPDEKLANRSLLFAPGGEIAARYDKIHMFDVDLGNGESYRESASFQAGDQAVVAVSPWGGIGLSICYDVRFAALYRSLAQAGASILTIPAAFTVPTGQAHWQVLLRARAIETGCFVLAPAQCGTHDGGRRTYGHSLIISPWGEILADGGEAPGIIIAKLDLAKVTEARAAIPAWNTNQPFTPPPAIASVFI